MRIILSRKGCDSSAGGIASPILPSGRLLSIPIPETNQQKKLRRYSDIRLCGQGCDEILANLSPRSDLNRDFVHLDPDLSRDVTDLHTTWRPAFGQAGAAQGHLRRKGVGIGDLFLFFGWFRNVTSDLKYAKPVREQHALFGWLQVGHCIDVAAGEEDPCLAPHPHLLGEPYDRSNDMVYVASSALAFPGVPQGLPGAGVFGCVAPSRVLTADGQCRSEWQLPSSFVDQQGRLRLSHHANRVTTLSVPDYVRFRAVGRGQEFVIECETGDGLYSWLTDVFQDAA